jgi:hypothetical protein
MTARASARARATTLLALATFAGSGGLAYASPADSALADALFRDGKALEAKGDNAAACPKFEESYRLDPKVGTLLNMAQCHEAIGKTGTAWGEFNEAQAEARAQKTTRREEYAKKHAADLEARLSKVTFVAVDPGDRDLTLRLDGKDLGSAPLGTPLPLDPGVHELVAHAEGRESYATKVTVPVGPATQTVTIPHLEKSKPVVAAVPPPPPPVITGTGPSTSISPGVDHESPHGSSLKTAGVVTLIGGGVVLAVAGTFGGLALSKHNNANCVGTHCTPDGVQDQKTARNFATVSTVTTIVGAVGAGLGIVFIIAAPPRHDPASAKNGVAPAAAAMWLHPSVGPGGGTAEWGISF